MCSGCGAGPLWKNNRSGYCSACYEKNRPRRKKGSAEWLATKEQKSRYYQSRADEWHEYTTKRRYGLTAQQYQKMLEGQEYRCAICRRHRDEFPKNFSVDHDHNCCPVNRRNDKTCGMCVRGLLCVNCNQGLGSFRDEEKLLLAAIKYLNK